MRAAPPDQLGVVLFGKAKRAILSRLFGSPEKRFYVRELARVVELTPSTLSRDLSALAQAGVILRAREGNQVYYQANSSSPVFHELRGLVTKTFGIADVLREMLSSFADKIEIAAIYGSVARGEHSSQSDVDLLIVGEVRSAEFADNLVKAEQDLGRAISPTIYPLSEFRTGSKKNPFLKAIFEKPMIFLIGDKHELKRISEGQASKSR